MITCKCLNIGISLNRIGSSPSSDEAVNGLAAVLSCIQKDAKYQKNSKFCKELVDFIRNHAKTQPLNDLQLNTSQKDLVLTIPIRNWEITYCLNCNTITHAVQQTTNTIVINDSLQKSYDDMVASKADQSFSSTFGITMLNHQRHHLQHNHHNNHNHHQTHPNNNVSSSKLKPLQTLNSNNHHHLQSDERQLRLKNLEKTLEQRTCKEIRETEERIARYSEQQYALLNIFREKSENEYQNLVSLVQNVPENLFEMQFSSSTNDEQPQPQNKNKKSDREQQPEHPTSSDDVSDTSAIKNSNSSDTQQITSFDTPPATPESTPMSVGNSPVFRQQQQQTTTTSTANNVLNGFRGLLGAVNNGAVHTTNISSTSIMNMSNNNNLDDCLFDFEEGLETYPTSVSVAGNSNNGNNMSDDEEDDTEDAQDALGELDSNPSYGRRYTIASSLNVARSVPIGITTFEDDQNHVPRSRRNNFDSDDEILDDNIDIAASIKALAKSVHGDKVFGELPRPRFSYKI